MALNVAPRAHLAILRSQAAIRATPSPWTRPTACSLTRCFATESKQSDNKSDFQSGLALSIMGRLQRERKNMEKYAQEREKLRRAEWWTATVCKGSLVA